MFRQVNEKGQPWADLLQQMLVIGEELQKIMIIWIFKTILTGAIRTGKSCQAGSQYQI